MPLKNGVLDDEMKPGRGGNVETIESFCDRHGACHDGKKWALENCSTMVDVWGRAKPEWLIWIATQDGVIDDKTIRLFACWCVRQVWHLLDDERSRNAVVASEKYANEEATKKELDIARDAARAAAWASACDAAWASAREAARDAERYAARDAALINQAKWLRENAKPNFKLSGGVR